MAIQFVCCLACLLVTLVTHSHGFQFSMTRTPNNSYCGYLQCSVNISQTDTHIHTLIGLTISDIVQTNTHIRLASVSVFDPEPHVELTRVLALNATGSVSRYHGNLTVALRDETDCQFGSFLCELTFVNINGQSDRVSEIIASDSTDTCEATSDPLVKMTTHMKTHLDNVDRKLTDIANQLSQQKMLSTDRDLELTEVRSQNSSTEQELVRDRSVAMETKLDQIIELLSNRDGVDNSTCSTSQLIQLDQGEYVTVTPVTTAENETDTDLPTVTCKRGERHARPREKIRLWGTVQALCDTESDGGGWIIIQRRTKGDVGFYKRWADYKKGFGTPDTDYWLGNDNIHNLTQQGYTHLRVDLVYEGQKYFAAYFNFEVAANESSYRLIATGYHGDAGDALNYHSGYYFATSDKDNYYGCSKKSQGAWWYGDCYTSNLNGIWGATNEMGLYWKGSNVSGIVSSSEMKVRLAY